MNKRLPVRFLIVGGMITVGLLAVDLAGQDAPTRGAKTLTERTQLRPVGKKDSEKLWFAPGSYWVDGFDGGVQSGTLDETRELQIWNTSRRETFGPGFIRFERAAGGIKEGVLASDTEQCVVNTASNSKKRLTFAGKSDTVEYGYDGCVMKGTIVKAETLKTWDGKEQTFPAGSRLEFDGAGLVTRSTAGATGVAGFDGLYGGTATITCPPNVYWLEKGKETKTIPFEFTAAGGAFQGSGDDKPYSLKWRGNYDATGRITAGSMTGWVDFDHPEYRSKEPKLRWTITGPLDGTLAKPAAGTLTINTSTDIINDERPVPTDRLSSPIVCTGVWSVTRGIGAIKPTPEGEVLDIKGGRKGSLDLIFVIDQTSSMKSVFEQVQKTAKAILASISKSFPDFRVAIVAYRDWGDTEMFKDVPFTTSETDFQAAIDGLKAEGGGDVPEAVLEALLRALRLPWRNGVNKQIILMGDAPPHSPVPQGEDAGKTAADVAKLAFEVDPAVINTIATPVSGSINKDTLAAFEDLAARTKGTSVTADKAEEVPKKIMDMVEKIAVVPPDGGGGGGGGGPVLPSTGLSPAVIVVVLLLGACALLVAAIIVVRQRGAGVGAGARPTSAGGIRVNAGLTITFADGRTMQFRVTGARTTIGRGEDNVLVIPDGETSSHHAEILASREGFRLRDAGSANGTTLNGQPITDAELRLGDQIGMGTTRMTFTE